MDVKKNRKGEAFLIITESKKVLSKDLSQPCVFFEKHKLFLNKEDFDKFLDALNEAISIAKINNAADFAPSENSESIVNPIHLKIDF